MDYQTILDDHRIAYHDSGSGTRPGWINHKCPFCEKDPYMGFHLAGKYVHCWNCGRHPLVKTLNLLTGLPYDKCKALVGEIPGDERVRRSRVCGTLKYPPGVVPMMGCHRRYLQKERKIDPTYAEKIWGVQGINQDGGRLAWRILIPIYQQGKVVSWTSRRFTNEEPRYWAASDQDSFVSVNDCVLGADLCRHTILVVEGPMDALAIGPGAGSTMGVRVSDAKLNIISRFPVRCLLFDAEPKAQARARKLCRQLAAYEGRTVNIRLESGKDPASASLEELTDIRRKFLFRDGVHL